MGFRLTCRGGEALSRVAASVVCRLARDAGLDEDVAARLAGEAQGALDAARGLEISVSGSDGLLTVAVRPGKAAGEMAVLGTCARAPHETAT